MFWRDDINPEEGPFKVLLGRGEFVDEARDRVVPYKIYYPVDHGLDKTPVIVWSHGFGGNRDGASFLSRYIASHGYMLAHLTHHGTDSSLWEGKDGHPWDILKNVTVPRETTLARFHDVPFALDQLEHWAQENPEAGQYMDFESLGISGHSFGAMTTQVMAGQHIPDLDDELIRLHEPRFKAGIAYSPVPISHLTDASHETLYGPISMPLLHMTGTDDKSPLGGYGYEPRTLIYEHTAHPEKYLLVKKGGDHMVYNGTRGKLERNPLRKMHEEIIKISSLAFWDAQLKNDEAARAWLLGDGFASYISGNAEFKTG